MDQTPTNLQPNPTTNTVEQPEVKPEVKTGAVINEATATTTGELSGGSQAAIGVGIGVGNICCGQVCYACPTLLSSAIGIILYAVWHKEKPKTAKNILIVTLVTGAIGFAIFALLLAFGMIGSMMSNFNY
ncbi:MAG: hypothetical protein WCV88_02380 [Patescibacteria group bacterium]|jgi:hypothetical protein